MPKTEDLYQASNKYRATNKIKGLKALHDHVLVHNMSFEARKLASGIVLLGDDGKTDGIRPRWAQVYAIGPEQQDVKVGQWVLVEHGRWTRGFIVEIDDHEFTVRRVDPDCIIFAQDEEPDNIDTISTAVHAERKRREQYE
jgi:hypothetical protein